MGRVNFLVSKKLIMRAAAKNDENPPQSNFGYLPKRFVSFVRRGLNDDTPTQLFDGFENN